MASAETIFTLEADVGQAVSALRQVQSALKGAGVASLTAGDEIASGTKRGESSVLSLRTQMDSFASASAGSWKSAVAGLGATLGGVFAADKLAGALRSSVLAAAEAEDATNALRDALAAQGPAAALAGASLAPLATQLQNVTRYSDEAILGMQALGLNLGVPAAQMGTFTAAAVDMATALRIGLNEAAQQLAQTLDGSVGRLGQRIPELQSFTAEELKAGKAIEFVGERFRNFAVSDATTLGGALDQLKNQWDEASESLGKGIASGADLSGSMAAITESLVQLTPVVMRAGEGLGMLGAAIATDIGWLIKLNEHISPLGVLYNYLHQTGTLAEEGAGGLAPQLLEVNETITRLGVRLDDLNAKHRAGAISERDYAEAVRETSRDLEANEKIRLRLQRKITTTRAGSDDFMGPPAPPAAVPSAVTPGGPVAAPSLADTFETFKTSVASAQSAAVGFNMSLADQVAITDSLIQKGESLRSGLLANFQDPKASAQELLGTLDSLDVRLAALAARRSELGAVERDRFLQQRQDEMAAGGGIMDFMSADAATMQEPGPDDFAAGDASMAREQHAQRIERINELAMQYGSLTAAVAAYNEEIGASGERLAALSPAEEANAKSLAKQTQHQQMAQMSMRLMGQAGAQLASGLMQMAITGEGSMKQMAQGVLQGLAIQAAGQAVMQIAEHFANQAAFAATGAPNFEAAAVANLVSAKFYGMVAGVAGAGAVALGGGGGAGGGGGREGGGLDNEQRQRAATTPAEPPGPRVQVTVNGGFVGTNPEDVARHLERYVSDAVRDSGGRSGSVRG